ncbi:MAG TPA: hypothetical protein VEI07_21910, partial [Planctomycetaceae bacterium]|nr:hypothetical protein [Planctomycetaceae bacterium]
DGKIDAFVVNLGAPGTLLRNVTQNSNHCITIKLKGQGKQKKSNRDGIGARLELLAGGRSRSPNVSPDRAICPRTMAASTSV